MILSVIVILLVGLIAYFHYVEGFFSATISAICAVLASVMAFSYHEAIVRSLLAGKMADSANGMMLIVSFGLYYIILRLLFDGVVPGNVRVPLAAEKVGGAVMGVVAGCFAMGVITVAAQSMPFGPSVGGYARYDLGSSRDVQTPNRRGGQNEDLTVNDELKGGRSADASGWTAANAKSLWIPVDDLLVNTVGMLSRGALGNGKPLTEVHPNYLDEMFGQRLGIQAGAKHVLIRGVELDKVYVPSTLTTKDFEIKEIREKTEKAPPASISGTASSSLIVVRIKLTNFDDTDDDKNYRFSTGAVRLCCRGTGDGPSKNYMPIGVMDSARTLRLMHPDDFGIITPPGENNPELALVFSIPLTDLASGAPAPVAPAKGGRGAAAAVALGNVVREGNFLEFRRFVINLSGQPLVPGIPNGSVGFLVKGMDDKDQQQASTPTPTPTPTTPKPDEPKQPPPPKAAPNPLTREDQDLDDALPNAVNVGSHPDDGDATFDCGTATFKGGAPVKLTVDTRQSVAEMKKGDFTVEKLGVPGGKQAFKIRFSITPGVDPWDFAEQIGEYSVKDEGGGTVKPSGAIVTLIQKQEDKLIVNYDAGGEVTSITRTDGRPKDVFLVFLLPENKLPTHLYFKGSTMYQFKTSP